MLCNPILISIHPGQTDINRHNTTTPKAIATRCASCHDKSCCNALSCC